MLVDALLFLLFVLVLLYFLLLHRSNKDMRNDNESFVGTAATAPAPAAASAGNALENKVVDLYEELLERPPSAKELIVSTRSITNKVITLSDLKQQIMDSEEFEQKTKLQSNTMEPYIRKFLSDRELIEKVAAIYKEEHNTNVPAKMGLPLKDILIHLDYNQFTLRALLRSSSYPAFEEDSLRNERLNKAEFLMDFDKLFDKSELEKQGELIRKSPVPSTVSKATKPSVEGFAVRSILDTDSDMSPLLNGIIQRANAVFDKDAAATRLP